MAKKSRTPPTPARFGDSQRLGILLALLALLAAVTVTGIVLRASEAQAAWQSPNVLADDPRIVYSELTGQQSTLWIASAADLPRARPIATVSHREGYGLRAALSPDGKRIAYLVLPASARNPWTEGALWVMGIDGRDPLQLLSNADMHSAPIWSRSGEQILVREASVSDERLQYTLVAVDTDGGSATKLVPEIAADGLYPIGWSEDGQRLYYATLTREGTDIQQLELLSGRVERVFHASDGIARDFRLSSQGDRLLYSEYQPLGQTAYRVRSTELGTGVSRTFLQSERALLSPVWRPGEPAVTLGSEPAEARLQGGLGALSGEAGGLDSMIAPAPSGGFLAPLAWSSDGAFLAARLLHGDSLQQTKGERLVVVSPARHTTAEVAAKGYAELVGWLP